MAGAGNGGARQLVDVVEQRARLHERAIHLVPPVRGAGRQPRRHVRDDGRVPHEPRGRLQGAQQAGGLAAIGDRHGHDRIRWARPSRPCRDRRPGRPGSLVVRAAGRQRRPGRDRDRAREAATPPRRTTRFVRSTGTASPDRAAVGSRRAARRGPLVRTVSPASPSSIVTEPSWSVRRVRAPASRSRASVAGAGWPYVLPAPAEATATRGRTASTNAWVVAVRLPWCATLSRSTRGRPRASRAGSMPSSTSPIEQEPPPVRLAEQHDRDVVDPRSRCPAARPGPSRVRPEDRASRPRRARSRAPVASMPRAAAPSRSSRVPRRPAGARAAHAGLVDAARRAYRSRIRARPATWSSCGWVRTTRSSRRSQGGIRSSSATSSRSGSGPPSTSIRAPRPASRGGSRRPVRRRGR